MYIPSSVYIQILFDSVVNTIVIAIIIMVLKQIYYVITGVLILFLAPPFPSFYAH